MSKNYYQPVYSLVIKDFNGWLTAAEQEKWKKSWIQYVETTKPLTREIYKDLPKEIQRKMGTQIFGLSGGLWLNSGGAADDFWDSLFEKYAAIAKDRSKKVRLKNGWTINARGHMTDPRGRSKGPNGQLYGPYAPVNVEPSINWEQYLKK